MKELSANKRTVTPVKENKIRQKNPTRGKRYEKRSNASGGIFGKNGGNKIVLALECKNY